MPSLAPNLRKETPLSPHNATLDFTTEVEAQNDSEKVHQVLRHVLLRGVHVADRRQQDKSDGCLNDHTGLEQLPELFHGSLLSLGFVLGDDDVVNQRKAILP